MYVTSDDVEELKLRNLCSSCVNESYLKKEIENKGTYEICDYCGGSSNTSYLYEVAEYIDGAFDRHYRRTPTEAEGLELLLIKEGVRDWEREGEPAVDAIAEAAEIDKGPADDIRKVLADQYYDVDAAEVGEECPFDECAYYDTESPDDTDYQYNWRDFENSVKTEARMFNGSAEATLGTVFEALEQHQNIHGRQIIVDAGPNTELSGIYRARVFQDRAELEKALCKPWQDLGPPPAKFAKAGRMNAHGVSVFYGATRADVAVGEVRPPVGSRVAVAEFKLQRTLRLLDVAALRSLYVEGSIFNPEFINQLKRAKFLKRLSELFAKPVMPSDEDLEYIPTQAIAEYLAHRMKPELDGIIYPSVQAEAEAANIVLFHKSSRVAQHVPPRGTNISVHSGMPTEDGWEEDWVVWEEVPETDDKIPEREWSAFFSTEPSQNGFDTTDTRKETLATEPGFVEIRLIKSVNYEGENMPVRHRRDQVRKMEDSGF